MKKLIAMVMTAAMVASLVPATAFASDDIDATAKVVNSWTRKDSESLTVSNSARKYAPELQIKLDNVNAQGTNPTQNITFEIALDGAKFNPFTGTDLGAGVEVKAAETGSGAVKEKLASPVYAYEKQDADQIKALLKDYFNGTDLETQSVNSSVAGKYIGWYTADTSDKVDDTTALDTNLDSTPFKFAGAAGLTEPVRKSAKDNANAAAELYADAELGGTSTDVDDDYNFDAKGTGSYGEKGWIATKIGAVPAFISYADVVSYAEKTTSLQNTVKNGDFVATTKDTEATWVTDNYTDLVDSGGALDDKDLYKVTGTVAVATAGIDPTGSYRTFTTTVTPVDVDAKGNYDTIKLNVQVDTRFAEGDVISIDLLSVLDKAKTAYVSVTSDDITISNDGEDLVYVSVEDEGVTASIKKVATVAEEEHTVLSKDLVIKSTVGNFENGQVIELKLNNGFEFFKVLNTGSGYTLTKVDDNIVELVVNGASDKIEVKAADIEIEATDAKSGATAVITVKATNKNSAGAILTGAFNAKTTVEVMKVVDYTVVLTVDEDEEVPVFYNGVNVDNYGLTDDADHWSLEVTAEETFPGAWSFRKGFNFELPEGVFVTDVEITNVEGFLKSSTASGTADVTINKAGMKNEFVTAYQDGDNVNFEFDKRVFDDVDATLAKDEASVSFKLQLVADPDFTNDVTLELTGDLVDTQEVVIAKFVAPFTVKAEQNDLKIDYRYTSIPTTIVVTEAEAGLWDKGKAEFGFAVEKPDYIVFEDDPTFTVDKESGMELDDDKLMKIAGSDFEYIHFTVDKESDEAATVTISNMSLFMQRSIPAGAYDLEAWTSMWANYEAQPLFAPNCTHSTYAAHDTADCDELSFVGDVCDYSDVVKEAFVNVVTAGREQDDASFTTKVVVPVGEKYIVAGEKQVEIDVPAYINAAGYTMLPVRAVATALGINNNNVLWDQATKTVTILYGQRIITMQVGAKVVYANGAALPASSSVEITDSRTFLGLRDLATALGVTDITWDAATKTATLNGGETKAAE